MLAFPGPVLFGLPAGSRTRSPPGHVPSAVEQVCSTDEAAPAITEFYHDLLEHL
jgi:hypothetical protein